jgi:tetrathionate reductase subunit B
MTMQGDTNISRRDFLRKAGAATTATVVVAAAPMTVNAAKQEKRYAMVIDTRRCSGCQACSIACKTEFEVPIGAVRSWVEHHEAGRFPQVERRMLPRLCNHCSEPPCTKVCPKAAEGATYKRDEDGIVVVDESKCIGCAKCVEACPYDARFMNPFKGDMAKTKGNGAVDKCDFCLHRVSQGLVPSCVNTCPGKARIFGDLNDPTSEVSKLIAEFDATVLRRDKKTKPSVMYLGADWIEAKRDKKAAEFSRLDAHRNEQSSHRFI